MKLEAWPLALATGRSREPCQGRFNWNGSSKYLTILGLREDEKEDAGNGEYRQALEKKELRVVSGGESGGQESVFQRR